MNQPFWHPNQEFRVHQADVPMPYAKNLERAAKPDVAKTIAAVRKVMYLD